MAQDPNNGHSVLAPSAASRWTICTASPAYLEAEKHRIPPQDTEYSDEGTVAHHWGQMILNGLADVSEIQAGKNSDGQAVVELTEEQAAEMREAVGVYVRHCEAIRKQGGTVFIEKKVPLFYRPEDSGTVDFAVLSEKVLRVRDYKHGVGVVVEAKQNKQTAIYAMSLISDLEEMGLWDFPDDMLVDIGIVQPRAREGEPIKLWAVSVRELREFCHKIQVQADLIHAAEEGEAPSDELEFVPQEGDSGTCRFCPAKGFCQARKAERAKPLPFDLVNLPDLKGDPELSARSLTEEQITAIILGKPDLVKWLNDVESYAVEAIQNKIGIKGLKLVRGRMGNRSWTDEEAADKLIAKYIPAKDRYTKKLLSVTQAEKMLPKFPEEGEKATEETVSTRFANRFKELVVRPEGKATLAREDDPRPSIIETEVSELPDLGTEEIDPLA